MAHKTTIYLPDDLRTSVKAEARRRGCSEAEVIRAAVAAAVSRPKPTPALFDAPPFAAESDDHLAGFGDR